MRLPLKILILVLFTTISCKKRTQKKLYGTWDFIEYYKMDASGNIHQKLTDEEDVPLYDNFLEITEFSSSKLYYREYMVDLSTNTELTGVPAFLSSYNDRIIVVDNTFWILWYEVTEINDSELTLKLYKQQNLSNGIITELELESKYFKYIKV